MQCGLSDRAYFRIRAKVSLSAHVLREAFGGAGKGSQIGSLSRLALTLALSRKRERGWDGPLG